MRKVIVAVFVSLDGVMQAPGGPDEDTESGFEFGGWTFPYFDETAGDLMDELFKKDFELLLGRKTYDIFAAYWPRYTGDENQPIAEAFNRVAKYVATRTNPQLAWNNSHSLGADVVEALREMKKGDGPMLLVQGSSDFIQTLLANNLVDEFRLLIFPVLLGNGKRLFGNGTAPAGMKLIGKKVSESGVIAANYVPDGEVKTGSFT